MGPFVPDLVTNELNLVVALLLGVAFGFILEQAGFSSSRKLTGLFYGTDFTVLRVFFTAGVTAMTGVLLLSKAGLLDATVIYVHPTFIQSALIGGLIMGVGFVVGGFCPGTSFCAAAVGRVDGMVFIVGGLAGVLLFGEAFPAVRGVYGAGSLGDPTVPALLGVSPGVVLVAMIAFAIGAFVLTSRIERRVNRDAPSNTFAAGRHRLGGVALLVTGVIVAASPDYRDRLLATAGDEAHRRAHPTDRMTPDELAFRIVDADPALLLIDVRPAATFETWTLPGAVSVTPSDLFGRGLPPGLAQIHRRKVFFAEDERQGDEAAALARLLGHENVAVLEGGLAGFRATILDAPGSASSSATGDPAVKAFRANAARRITTLVGARTATPVVRKPKKVAGGCGV
jgi:rhodanese-related sulfurtransferase